MKVETARHFRFVVLLVAITVCAILTCPLPVAAQGRGGGRGGGGGGPPGGRPPPGTPPPDSPPSGGATGQETGRIVKFKPAKDSSGDEELLGVLIVKSFVKESTIVKMKVHRQDELKIKVGDHLFEDVDDYSEVFWKGLQCTASWIIKDPNARRKTKELRSLTFDTIDVEGKIYKIEDGLVIVKAVPTNGRQWPDLDAKNQGSRSSNRQRRIPTRKLKLKILEDISEFLDEDKDEAELDDFEVNQKVEATIVYGRPYGMLVALHLPAVAVNDSPGPDGDGRPGRP